MFANIRRTVQLICTKPSAIGTFIRSARGTSSAEAAMLVALMVAAIFLGLEIYDRSMRQLDAETSSEITASAEPAGEGWLPTNEYDPRYLTMQIIAGCGFVLTAAGFVARSVWRKSTETQRAEALHQEIDERLNARHQAIIEKRQTVLKMLSRVPHERWSEALTVEFLMSSHLVRVNTHTTAKQVRELMAKQHIRHVLVCDAIDGRLVGLISDRDLDRRPTARMASDLMTADPACLHCDSPILPAVTMLLERRINCLPVVDAGRPVGVLTTTDLLMAMQCMLQSQMRLSGEPAAVEA